ncbi:hypothetical protein Psuf_004670 [Phytohabitans suffuscus]|uniref:Uncharacterized protein n=1 Tax=Phytohabitans suffuscus TaxID=624315 RepID=A0A6F8YAJ6_9ACTN|nr:hypothetical protein Psuf_004670 [Phytohabitans suffuscus]
MRRGTWKPTDRVDGPLDRVFDGLRATFPELWVERLRVTHAADDDNVWYLGRQGSDLEIQIDSAPGGAPPFILESETALETVDDVRTALERLSEWLRR